MTSLSRFEAMRAPGEGRESTRPSPHALMASLSRFEAMGAPGESRERTIAPLGPHFEQVLRL